MSKWDGEVRLAKLLCSNHSMKASKECGFYFKTVGNHQSSGSPPCWAQCPLLITLYSALSILKWKAEMTLPVYQLYNLLCCCIINYMKASWLCNKKPMIYHFCGLTVQLVCWSHLSSLMWLLLLGDWAGLVGPGWPHLHGWGLGAGFWLRHFISPPCGSHPALGQTHSFTSWWFQGNLSRERRQQCKAWAPEPQKLHLYNISLVKTTHKANNSQSKS